MRLSVLAATVFLMSAFLVFAQSSETIDLQEPATEDTVVPVREDSVEAVPIYGESMIDGSGRCTVEAQASGECVQCLGSEPIPPWSDEAKKEKAHNMDCYILRTKSWTDQQSNLVDDVQSLQDTTYTCELGAPGCPFSDSLQPSSPTLTGQFAGQDVTSVLSSINTQLDNIQRLVTAAGLTANSRLSQSLSLLRSAVLLLNQRYLGTYTDSTELSGDGSFSSVQDSYTNPQVSGKTLDGVDLETLSVLDYITQRVNHPIVVTSAYRDEGHNTSVGGASGSQHMQGKALDLSMNGLSLEQKINLVNVILSHPSVNGFGYYTGANSVHFDTRAVRLGKGYWGPDYSYTSFDQGAHFGLIDREIVDLVYAWSGS